MGETTANSWPLIQPEKAVKCAENTQNHQKWTEPGPYGSVWADTCTESIPRALGSLWDASRPLERPQKTNKSQVLGFRGQGGGCPPIFPICPLKACGPYFNLPTPRGHQACEVVCGLEKAPGGGPWVTVAPYPPPSHICGGRPGSCPGPRAQGCAGAARNPKGPQNQPFCHQMGRRGTIWDLVTGIHRRILARFS